MKLTKFGFQVRALRMRYDRSLKDMANAMEVSSPFLSALEYGEKKLNQKHVDAAVAYFRDVATSDQLKELRAAGAETIESLDTSSLSPTARIQVMQFMRRIQAGDAPNSQFSAWLSETSEAM